VVFLGAASFLFYLFLFSFFSFRYSSECFFKWGKPIEYYHEAQEEEMHFQHKLSGSPLV